MRLFTVDGPSAARGAPGGGRRVAEACFALVRKTARTRRGGISKSGDSARDVDDFEPHDCVSCRNPADHHRLRWRRVQVEASGEKAPEFTCYVLRDHPI